MSYRNDLVVLNEVLSKDFAPSSYSDRDEHFEFFVMRQLLKDYNLDDDQLDYGHTDGTHDGGIDGLYCFVNSVFCAEDTDVTLMGPNPRVDIWVVTSKNRESFRQDPVDSASLTLHDLFDLSVAMETLDGKYNDAVLRMFGVIRRVLANLGSQHVELHLHYKYASLGEANGNMTRSRVDTLESQVGALLQPGAVTDFSLLGASEIVELTRRQALFTKTLPHSGQFLSSRDCSYAVLVDLVDYAEFLSSEDAGALNMRLFESNVRAYKGDSGVNADIAESLGRNQDSMDFWWLNNGVTVVASKITISGSRAVLDNPQVVNGLQTSTVTHRVASEGRLMRGRSVLVKLVEADDRDVRARVIRAANYQNRLPQVALRATDELQKRIEEFLAARGFLYERQQNYYRAQGKRAADVVTISYLGQAAMTILRGGPDDARARPSTLLDKDEQYGLLFGEDADLEVYSSLVAIMKALDAYVATVPTPKRYSVRNFRFHVAWLAVMGHLGTKDYPAAAVARMSKRDISSLDFASQWNRIERYVVRFNKDRDWAEDKLAKSPAFTEYVRKTVRPGRWS